MNIRWSAEAAEDLEHILQRIREDNPAAAHEVVKTLYERVLTLKKFPNRGRPRREKGSRELVFTPLPSIAVYRVAENMIEISRIWHGAQDWP